MQKTLSYLTTESNVASPKRLLTLKHRHIM